MLTRAELMAATDQFAAARRVGEGGFGVVYGATLRSLPHAGRCAVKKLVAASAAAAQQAWLELAREIQLLGTCHHPCLLPLLGFCLDEKAPCLVYPLMMGGSLEDRLLLGT